MPHEREIDQLYQLPLRDFVSFRNALAASAKKAGDGEAAKRLKSLAKPSASAWAVNQIYWREREIFDALIDVGDRYRTALTEGGVDRVEHERHEAIASAVQRARSILESDRQNPSDTVMRRVATTLDAICSYGSKNPHPVNGRLTDDLEPAGFGALAGVSPRASPAPVEAVSSKPRPPLEDEVAPHRAALEAAQGELDRARERADALRNELEALKRRVLESERSVEDAAARVAEKRAALEEARTRAGG